MATGVGIEKMTSEGIVGAMNATVATIIDARMNAMGRHHRIRAVGETGPTEEMNFDRSADTLREAAEVADAATTDATESATGTGIETATAKTTTATTIGVGVAGTGVTMEAEAVDGGTTPNHCCTVTVQ